MSVEKALQNPMVKWLLLFFLSVCIVGFGVAPFLPDAKAAIGLISLVGVLLAVVFYVMWNYSYKLFGKK